jgi:ubiquinone/menaquinone biosynthesis C-methylase UbiE
MEHTPLSSSSHHNDIIIDQFTKQAIPFANLAAHSHEEAFKLLVALSDAGQKDVVLDIACGPGLLACELAKATSRVTGIDLTPAMIEQAKILQQQKGLNNITWDIGDVTHLPYDDASFSLVVTRYSFHHMIDPGSVLNEMKRVCLPGGRVVVVDVTPQADKINAYNYVEKLRDPSHVRALTFEELHEMIDKTGLFTKKVGFYKLDVELEKILQASFPKAEDVNKIRQLFAEDIKKNTLGVGSYYKDSVIHFSFPVAIIVAQR